MGKTKGLEEVRLNKGRLGKVRLGYSMYYSFTKGVVNRAAILKSSFIHWGRKTKAGFIHNV